MRSKYLSKTQKVLHEHAWSPDVSFYPRSITFSCPNIYTYCCSSTAPPSSPHALSSFPVITHGISWAYNASTSCLPRAFRVQILHLPWIPHYLPCPHQHLPCLHSLTQKPSEVTWQNWSILSKVLYLSPLRWAKKYLFPPVQTWCFYFHHDSLSHGSYWHH